MLLFRNLWSIRFTHTYFKEPSYHGFKVVPDAETNIRCKEYGLSFKLTGGTLMCSYKEEDDRPSLLHGLKFPLRLTCYVYYQDQMFLNYSDINLDHLHECFLLKNAYPVTDGQAVLHEGPQVSETEKVIQVSSFQDMTQYLPADDVMVEVTAPVTEEQPLFSGRYGDFKTQYTFGDLRDWGAFNIQAPDAPVMHRFYALPQLQKGLFGLLEVTINPGDAAAAPVQYSANIGAKPVRWRYNVIEKSQAVLENFHIYAGKQVLKLNPVEKAMLGNGAQAFVLEPEEPIVLCESYEYFYEMDYQHTDAKVGKIAAKKRIGLPLPDINRIKVSKHAEGFKAYSDMYIYL